MRSVSSPALDQAAAEAGLAFLALRADPQWIHRRIERLEFIDTATVQWRISIDFFIPDSAPTVNFGDDLILLVPITDLPKGRFPEVSRGDGRGSSPWLPIEAETTHRLASALIAMASVIVGRDLPSSLIGSVEEAVSAETVVSSEAPFAVAAQLIDAKRAYRRARRELAAVSSRKVPLRRVGRWYAAWHRRIQAKSWMAATEEDLRRAQRNWVAVEASIRPIVNRLMADGSFRRHLEELSRNAVLVVGIEGQPGARRVVEVTQEAAVSFRIHSGGRLTRLVQNLGWRSWPLAVNIGGRGGSEHFEVATPTGAEVVRLVAEPLSRGSGAKQVAVLGGTPHASVQLPAGGQVRYRTTIFLRVSRRGWLTSSWLVAMVICAFMLAGRYDLSALYSATTGQALEVVTLVPALAGVFTTLLVGSREHPFVSRLLLPVRLLILADFIAVFLTVGDLALHSSKRPLPVTLWSYLAAVTYIIAFLVTLSWFLPARHRGRFRARL